MKKFFYVEVLNLFFEYLWFGNVCEFENIIECFVLIMDENSILF